MKRLFFQVLILMVAMLAGLAQLQAQCSGPMSTTIQGSGTGLPLSASETHINAQCPDDNGSVTISAMGGTLAYSGTGTFSQPVGTQVYTVVDMFGCMATVSVTITSNPRPTGAISGSTTICSGLSTTLTLNVTGSGTISGTLSDGTNFSGTAPTILVTVSPTMTTTYTIASLMDDNCSSIPADLSGSATVTVLYCTYVSGKIIWEGNRLAPNPSGVNLTTVTLSGHDNDVNITGLNGLYNLFADMGTLFEVTPKKNRPLPFAMDGLTAADASRIQQHVTGSFPITDPYKLIAADPNKTNTITTADAYLIQQAVLGNPTARNWFANNTWRFVPAATPAAQLPPNSWLFPEKIPITGPGSFINKDFIGMKLGDVNSSANPAVTPGTEPDLVWKVQDQTLQQDASFTAEFRAMNFDELLALQFGLQFDVTKLQFLGIETIAGSPLQAGNFGLYTVTEGEIRAFLAMAATMSLPNGTPGFRLKFKVLEGGGKLSEVMHLNNDILLGEAYNNQYTPGPVTLVYEGAATGTNELEQGNFSLLQNVPNPFMDKTVIGFILPEACEARIRIYDNNGRFVAEQKGWYKKGLNGQEFRADQLAGDGVLYYELITPYGKLSKKMMLLKE